MTNKIVAYDPTANDVLSKVRGVGRYLQILRENFPDWNFTNKLEITRLPARQGNSKLEIFVNPFFNFLQPPLILKRIAKKQIAVIHDLIPLKYPDYFPVGLKGRLNIFLNKLALKNYDLIVTDSEASKKDIMKILSIDERKIKVIYPCPPKMFTNSEFRIQNSELKTRNEKILNSKFNSRFSILDSKFCLYVGDATWNKNLVNLAKAIKEINVTCIFVGKVFGYFRDSEIRKSGNQNNLSFRLSELTHPWQKELKEFNKETRNDKRFIFAGFVADNELIQLYRNAHCNILVSRDEGFGFSYLEAASQRCPSVLSDIAVLKEISGSKGALFVNPEKPNNIANAIGELYFNNDIKYTLGLDAYRRTKYFGNSSFKNEFKKILKF